MNISRLLLGLLCVALIFGLEDYAAAAAPDTINYQAKLTDLSGALVPDGQYHLEVSLYEAASGGAPVWTETRTGANTVAVTNGLFSIQLGALESFVDVDFTESLFLGLTICGDGGSPVCDSEMSPRRPVGATAFSFVSDTLDGMDSLDFVQAGASNTISTSTDDVLLTLEQTGNGDILAVVNDVREVMTINQSGNVGIANDDPSELLTVGDSFTVNETGQVAATDGTAAAPAFRFVSDSDTGIFLTASNTLAFTTDGTEAATLDASGNLELAGGLVDETDDLGSTGDILQSTGTGFEWTDADSLGFGDGTFLGLADTPASYTTGSLLFTSASGVVEDNSNLFWDNINNRLGIGTSSPSLPLYVNTNNTGSVAWFDHAGDASNAVILGDAADATNDTGLFLRTTGVARINIGLGGELHFSDNGEVNMMIDGDGNVGIGTVDAEAINGGVTTTLHVENDTGTGDIEVARFEGGTDADDTYGVLRVNNANDRGFFVKGGRQVGNTAHAIMGTTDFDGNMTDTLSLFQGRVGVGVAVPSTKLHVAELSGVEPSYLGGTSAVFQRNTGASNANYVNIVSGTSGLGGLIFGDADQANRGGVVYDHSNDQLAFQTQGANDRLVIDSNGNVGIGSSTPSAQLAVARSSNTDYTLRVENGGGRAQGVNIIGGNTGSDASLFKIQNFSDTTFFEVTDGNSYFNNGNVGIGTDSLDALLTLEQQTDNEGLLLRGFDNQTIHNVSLSLDGSGNANLSATRVLNLESGISVGGSLGSEGETGLTWDAFSQFKFTGENFRIPLSVQSGGSADMFNVTSDGGDAGDVLTIDQNGNIGVGATVPGSKLHVDLSAGEVARFGDGLSASAIWGTNIGLISEENDARLTTRTAVTDLAFYTGGVANNLIEGTERMRVDAALGHVGIGDTNPDTRLSVSGNDIVVGKFERASSSGVSALQFKNNTAGMFIGIDGNENFAVATDKFLGTDPLMIVERGGSLGLGVGAPTAQLHTDGSVRFAFFSAGTLTTDNDGNVTASSDERLKNIAGDYERGIEAIIELEPIQYSWRPETGYDTDSLYTGFSAQNVEMVLPEAVSEDKRGFLTLSDRPIIAALVNAVKDIWLALTEQDDRITELEQENQLLEQRLVALEAAVRNGSTVVPVPVVPEVPETPATDTVETTDEVANPDDVSAEETVSVDQTSEETGSTNPPSDDTESTNQSSGDTEAADPDETTDPAVTGLPIIDDSITPTNQEDGTGVIEVIDGEHESGQTAEEETVEEINAEPEVVEEVEIEPAPAVEESEPDFEPVEVATETVTEVDEV